MSRHRHFVFHANTNGVRARAADLQRAASAFDVIALQETRIRTEAEALQVLSHIFPQHLLVASFPHDDEGIGCAILVRASLRHRATQRRTSERHRLLGIEVTLPDGLTFN
ncbi:MAG: endonuclease/exonuclease/phosphatase family protein, partial [Pseudomonadota bacterium]